MADYSHIRIKGERRHNKRQRRHKMKVSNRGILTVADVIRKKELAARK